MRTLRFLLEKEFRQILRDPAMIRLIIAMPLIQLIILPLAADYEVKNVRLAVVDENHSSYSGRLINKIVASGYFELTGYLTNYKDALDLVAEDKADIVLQLPANLEKQLVKEQSSKILLSVNAINGARANIGAAYLAMIIRDFSHEVRLEWLHTTPFSQEPRIEVIPAYWYNRFMNYQLFMVPGILVVLVTMVGCFFTALNIVREKEVGTIEQINVTPISKHIFIIGKLVPFWIFGMLVITLGMVAAWLVYGIVPLGSLGVIYLFAGVYLVAVLGLGLLISTFANTQQQAMLIAFFLLMIFILMGGLYTPIDSMPEWAQVITRFNPVAYFIEVMRMVVIKGSGLRDVLPQLETMMIFAVVLNAWAILSYNKRA